MSGQEDTLGLDSFFVITTGFDLSPLLPGQVKPYFGLGVNTAFEDIAALEQSLVLKGSRQDALAHYSHLRGKEAMVIVQMSESFDRPGLAGFLSFVLPLILDSIFNSAMPWLFKPNILTMLQLPDMTPSQVMRRKRLDRVMQVALIGAALWLASFPLVALAKGLLLLGSMAKALVVQGAYATAAALPGAQAAAALGEKLTWALFFVVRYLDAVLTGRPIRLT